MPLRQVGNARVSEARSGSHVVWKRSHQNGICMRLFEAILLSRNYNVQVDGRSICSHCSLNYPHTHTRTSQNPALTLEHIKQELSMPSLPQTLNCSNLSSWIRISTDTHVQLLRPVKQSVC